MDNNYRNWLKLKNFLDFLFTEGYIEEGTHTDMDMALRSLLPIAAEADDFVMLRNVLDNLSTDNILVSLPVDAVVAYVKKYQDALAPTVENPTQES